MKVKPIDIRYHFISDYYRSNKIIIQCLHVQSDENVAAVFTKPCRKPMLKKFKNYLFAVGNNI